MNSSKSSVSCVLFDLDGTLLDTAPDMLHALNAVLRAENHQELTLDEILSTASHGSAAMLSFAFGKEQNKEDVSRRQKLFLNRYVENICIDTTLFSGMENVLDELEQQAIHWGVVTNKPSYLTMALLDKIGLLKRLCSVISGDTLATNKPSPEPLFAAASECGALASECIYVGDAQRDIEAANRAGMLSLLASYGYIGENDQPETWQANGIISAPEEILDWLEYTGTPSYNTYQEQICH